MRNKSMKQGSRRQSAKDLMTGSLCSHSVIRSYRHFFFEIEKLWKVLAAANSILPHLQQLDKICLLPVLQTSLPLFLAKGLYSYIFHVHK